jgi:hypothetical protein
MGSFDSTVAEALAHHKAGRLAEAEACYRAAMVLAPGHPAVTHNLGVVAAARGDHDGALAHFDAVIAAEPAYAAAHYNRAVALRNLGHTKDAVAAFSRTATLDPGHYEAHRALGFLWLELGDRGRSLDHFARTYELRRGEDRTGMAERSLTHANVTKLRHDAEQFRHLAGRLRDGKRFEILARLYERAMEESTEISAPLTPEQLEDLGEDYNTAVHITSAPEIPGGAVNPALDAAGIAERFAAGHRGALWFDDLLSPAALAGLRRYLLESTVWHDFEHIGGFVATYLEDGLASPLLLQIADELRRAFPSILGPHPLSQAWAFKGLEGQSSVEAHADDAAVSVNFWVTPDAANLEPGGSGLRICLMPPPEAWRIAGYEEDKREIAAFLDRHRDETMVVPYGDNRAALFESRLFHRSDAPRFTADYACHRINVTLLYGAPRK